MYPSKKSPFSEDSPASYFLDGYTKGFSEGYNQGFMNGYNQGEKKNVKEQEINPVSGPIRDGDYYITTELNRKKNLDVNRESKLMIFD